MVPEKIKVKLQNGKTARVMTEPVDQMQAAASRRSSGQGQRNNCIVKIKDQREEGFNRQLMWIKGPASPHAVSQ
jgi:hypothetical protein